MAYRSQHTVESSIFHIVNVLKTIKFVRFSRTFWRHILKKTKINIAVILTWHLSVVPTTKVIDYSPSYTNVTNLPNLKLLSRISDNSLYLTTSLDVLILFLGGFSNCQDWTFSKIRYTVRICFSKLWLRSQMIWQEFQWLGFL